MVRVGLHVLLQIRKFVFVDVADLSISCASSHLTVLAISELYLMVWLDCHMILCADVWQKL